MNKIISSVSNDYIKQLSKLNSKKEILLQKRILVESEKVIKTILENNKWPILEMLVVEEKTQYCRSLINDVKSRGINVVYISESVANKLSDTVTTSGVFAVVGLDSVEPYVNNSKRILVLDNMQNPNNLGALIRSALAFGFAQIIMIDGVYPYLPKVVRSSMGYVFDVNIVQMSKQEFLNFAHKGEYTFITADMNGVELEEFKTNIDKDANLGIILGNEGAGVDGDLQSISRYTISIPMQNLVESLNVGVSGAIIMYELRSKN